MKIKNIEVKNFKAISEQSIELNGCSVIVTGGNRKGKSSMLKGLIDRLRGERPDIILKEGEKNGYYVMTLTDGAIIEWRFAEKTESFSYTTSDGIVMKSGVLSAIGTKYFGIKFDIDKFLNSGPATQTKTLANLVGLDFEAIDKQYKVAYEERTDANKELKRIGAMKLDKPIKVIKPNTDVLKEEKAKIVVENKKLTDKWEVENKKHLKGIQDFNKIQEDLKSKNETFDNNRIFLCKYKGSTIGKFIDFKGIEKVFSELKQPKDIKPLEMLKAAKIESTEEIENKIELENKNLILFNDYERDLKSYDEWIKQGKEARKDQKVKDQKVKDIQAEKLKMISGAKIPAEFEFGDDGIKYKGFPLSDAQMTSSDKYIAALKLGYMAMGGVEAMHFDASFLDKNSLSEIQDWIDKNDLQLLIERPDFDGGEIKYNII